MLSADQLYISQSTIEALNAAIIELQSRLVDYSPQDLQRALLYWFESSLELLAEDALFHVLEGRSDLTLGRNQFNDYLANASPHAARSISSSDPQLSA